MNTQRNAISRRIRPAATAGGQWECCFEDLEPRRLMAVIPVVPTLPGPEGFTLLSASQVSVTRGGFRLDRASGFPQKYLQVVTIQNTGNQPIGGPLSLELDNLSIPGTNVGIQFTGTALSNSSGEVAPPAAQTNPLAPYVNLDLFDQPNGVLAPGASASVVLEFLNGNNLPITYTTRVFHQTPAQPGALRFVLDGVPIVVDATHPLDVGAGDTLNTYHSLEITNQSGTQQQLTGRLIFTSDGIAEVAGGNFRVGVFQPGSTTTLQSAGTSQQFQKEGFVFLEPGAVTNPVPYKLLQDGESIVVNVRLINAGSIGGTGQLITGTSFGLHQNLLNSYAKQEIAVELLPLSGTAAQNIINGASKVLFGSGLSRTFRVRNVGQIGTTLTVSSVTASAGFSAAFNPATGQIVVTRNAGATTGTITILNNDVANTYDGDGAETKFHFTITATVAAPGPVASLAAPVTTRSAAAPRAAVASPLFTTAATNDVLGKTSRDVL